MPGETILFDLDGVLADSRAAIAGCINHALRHNGFPERPQARLHRFIGPPLAAAFAELTREPIDSAPVAACVAAYRKHYARVLVAETRPVPGMAPLLAGLTGRRPLGVATSKPLPFSERILEALGLRSHFDVVAGPGLAALAEDKSVTVAAALGELRCAHGVMVGDRSFDVVAAHANGLAAIGVTWGIGSANELATAGADVIVDTPAELAAALSG